MKDRPLLSKRDIWLLAGLLILALGGYLVTAKPGPEANAARISVNGHVYRTVGLSADGEFALEQTPHIRFSVRDGAIAFAASDCPDQVCVRSGYLSRPGQMAACLPNRVSLSVTGTEDAVDAVAG